MSLRFESDAMHHWKSVTCDSIHHLRDLSHCTSAVSSLLIQARRIHHHSSSFTQNKVLFRIYSLADSVFHKATTSLGDQPTLLAKKNKDSSEAQPSPLQTFTP